MKLKRLDSSVASFAGEFEKARNDKASLATKEIREQVADIIAKVRSGGEEALLQLTKEYDHSQCDSIKDLCFGREDFAEAYSSINPEITKYLERMKGNILNYHQRQIEPGWFDQDVYHGLLGQRFAPLGVVGVYVPGGKAVYPSSMLMGCLPAMLAGVERIIVVSPMGRGKEIPAFKQDRSDNREGDNSSIKNIIFAAAHICEVENLYSVGGAQAVAALSFGNAGLPKVDKIVGPGNAYVTEAKRQVFGEIGIDSLAGPTELFIIADSSSPVDWIVADIFAQAEHAEDSKVIFFSSEEDLIDKVETRISEQLSSQTRIEIIAKSLEDNAVMIKTKNNKEALELADSLAPEHLQIMTEDADELRNLVRKSSAVFLGPYTSTVYGDYGAGPNHILPTGGSGQFSSPLGVYDFCKRISFLGLDRKRVAELTPATVEIAKLEGLAAHAAAARIRINQPLNSAGQDGQDVENHAAKLSSQEKEG